MSQAFEMISESLNEIIQNLEQDDGKNLKREILTTKIEKNFPKKDFRNHSDEKFFEQSTNI